MQKGNERSGQRRSDKAMLLPGCNHCKWVVQVYPSKALRLKDTTRSYHGLVSRYDAMVLLVTSRDGMGFSELRKGHCAIILCN